MRHKWLLVVSILVIMAAGGGLWIIYHDVGERSKKGDFVETAFRRGDYEAALNALKRELADRGESGGLLADIARVYIRLARFEKAAVFFRRALNHDPDNRSIAVELGGAHLLSGNFREASAICEGLLKKSVNRADIVMLAGDIAMVEGRLASAETLYRKAVASDGAIPVCRVRLAVCLAGRGKRAEAEEVIRNVMTRPDKDAGLYVQLADWYMIVDDYANAQLCLESALRDDPRNRIILKRLAEFHFGTKNYEKAQPLLEHLVASNSRDRYGLKMLASVYLALGKPTEADAVLAKLKSTLEHDDAEYEMLQGSFWLLSGDPVYAASHFETAAKLSPASAVIRYFLGVAYLAGGQTQLGKNAVASAISIDPSFLDAILLKAEIDYLQGSYNGSIEDLNRILSKDPGNSQAYLVLGLNRMAQGGYRDAARAFDRALMLHPDFVQAKYYRGLVHELSGQRDNAMAQYARVLERNPMLADVTSRYAKLGGFEKGRAEDAAGGILKKFPEAPHLHFVAAEAARAAGDSAAAQTILQKWISNDTAPGYFYPAFADSCLNSGEKEKAMSTLELCTKRLPLFRDAWIKLAGIHLDDGEQGQARLVLEKADRTIPGDPVIRSNLAWVLLEMGEDLDLALEYARSAFDKAPTDDAIADTLGWAYYLKGNYGQAAWVLAELNDRCVKNDLVSYHLGMTFYRQVKMDAAEKHLERVDPARLGKVDRVSLETALKQIRKAVISEDHPPALLPEEGLNEALTFPGEALEKHQPVLGPVWKRRQPEKGQ